jgi:hypothetical protein
MPNHSLSTPILDYSIEVKSRQKADLRFATERIIHETAPKAGKRIADHINHVEKLDALTLEACKYVINHAIGAPVQKTVVSGDGDPIVIKFSFVKPMVQIEGDNADRLPG